MTPLIHLNYPLDYDFLLETSRFLKNNSQELDYNVTNARMARSDNGVFSDICSDFGVVGKPRIIWLEPNTYLPEHVDKGTKCSLNFLLSEDPAPINIEGKEYLYKQCLLDTTKLHSVKNNNTERILLKISIFENSFEEVANMIPKKYRG